MSIETNIKNLTAAIDNLTAALLGGATAAPAAAPAATKPAKAAAPAADPLADLGTAPAAAPAAAPAPAAEAPAGDISLKDVTAKVLELAKVDRNAATALLSEYGAARINDLKGSEAKFAEIIAKIDARLKS